MLPMRLRIFILVVMGIVMCSVLYMRGRYVFGGESLMFFSYLTWIIIAWRYEK